MCRVKEKVHLPGCSMFCFHILVFQLWIQFSDLPFTNIMSNCMLPALTSEIARWVESGLLEIGILHIPAFNKASPIRRGFKVARLGRPLDRPRGLVGANLVGLFLARPNLVSFVSNFCPTLSQLMLFLFPRPFPGEIGLIRLAYDLIDSGPFSSFPTLLPETRLA